MKIAGVGRAFPENYYPQAVLSEALKKHWAKRHFNLNRLEQLHRNVQVGGRHLALPIERYATLRSFTEANDAWIGCALESASARCAMRSRAPACARRTCATSSSSP